MSCCILNKGRFDDDDDYDDDEDDKINMTAIENSLMKSRSPQTLSCIFKTVMLLGSFSFDLMNFLNF